MEVKTAERRYFRGFSRKKNVLQEMDEKIYIFGEWYIVIMLCPHTDVINFNSKQYSTSLPVYTFIFLNNFTFKKL